MPAGRPTKFTKQVKQEILERMRSGENTRSICKDPRMPNWSNLMALVARDKEFQDLYAEARECMVDAWVTDSLAIACDRSRDTQTFKETIKSEKGTIEKERTCSDNSASMRDRLIVDTSLKVAAMMLPRKYGVKINEHTGANGGPIQYSQLVDKPTETVEQWQERVAKEMAAKQAEQAKTVH